jgi:hypothetical protein
MIAVVAIAMPYAFAANRLCLNRFALAHRPAGLQNQATKAV